MRLGQIPDIPKVCKYCGTYVCLRNPVPVFWGRELGMDKSCNAAGVFMCTEIILIGWETLNFARTCDYNSVHAHLLI